MHIYIDLSTNLPVLNQQGRPLLRPMAANHDKKKGRLKRWCGSFEQLNRACWKFGYSFKELFWSQPLQVTAEANLNRGQYRDSDFKHNVAAEALTIATGTTPKQNLQIAVFFGLLSEPLMLAYAKKHSTLIPKFKEVLQNEAMVSFIQRKHEVKIESISTLLGQATPQDSKEREGKGFADTKEDELEDPRNLDLEPDQQPLLFRNVASTQAQVEVRESLVKQAISCCRKKKLSSSKHA